MLTKRIAFAAAVLAVCSGPVTAQWEAFFSDPAGPPEPFPAPVDHIWAFTGEPFALDVVAFLWGPPIPLFAYDLDFWPTTPELAFDDYIDARGWLPLGSV